MSTLHLLELLGALLSLAVSFAAGAKYGRKLEQDAKNEAESLKNVAVKTFDSPPHH